MSNPKTMSCFCFKKTKTKMKIKGTKVSKLSLNSGVFLWENLLIIENKKLVQCTELICG